MVEIYYARTDVSYSGGDKFFTITFSYIKKEHINVYVNDEKTENFTFNTDSQIVVNDDLVVGDIVSIRRTTPIDDRMVVFSDTSILNKDAQNLAQEQLFNAVQEVYDNNIQFEIATNNLIEEKKQEILAIQHDFEVEVDNKLELVNQAADKINKLEEAVENAHNSSIIASEKAEEANQTLTNLTTTSNAKLEEMDTKLTTAQTLINNMTSTSETITNTVNTAISDIQTETQTQVDNIRATGFYMEDGKLYYDVNGEKKEFKSGGSGFSLFDFVLKDHILSFEESKGYALQGTYVYKDGVAGERYGYPDFYAKCVEEYGNNVDVPWQQPILTSNNSYGVVSSSSIYGDNEPYKAFNGITTGVDKYLSNSTSSGDITWELPEYIKINSCKVYTTAESSESTYLNRYPKTITILGSNNGTDWNTLVVKSEYAQPALGGYVELTIDNPKFYNYYKWDFGANFGGNAGVAVADIEINANTMFYKNPNGHIFYDIAQKDTVDAIFNSTGVAWFYGVDTANERIFLPRKKAKPMTLIKSKKIGGASGTYYNLYDNGYLEQGNYGTATPIGAITFPIPYKEGDIPSLQVTKYGVATAAERPDTGVTAISNTGFTFSKSSGGGTAMFWTATGYIDVNVEAKEYEYIVVGNTEATQSLTNVTEITTSKNDTMPLFTGMYFDFKPNNASWLKAGEQANGGGVYTSCYNTLVNCLTPANNIYNLKVIETSAMVAGVDYSEYWKVNQDDMTFVTPTKLSHLPFTGGTVPVYGNGNGLGLDFGDGKTYYPSSYSSYGNAHVLGGYTYSNGVPPIGVAPTGGWAEIPTSKIGGVTTDPSKSGLIANVYNATSPTAQLYFKVDNAVQNLELLDAGAITEALADKIGRQDCKAYITEIYENGGSRYRKYSDGTIEQWFTITSTSNMNSSTVHNLLIPYSNTNYNIFVNAADGTSSVCVCVTAKTTNGFNVECFRGGGANIGYKVLYVYAIGKGE